MTPFKDGKQPPSMRNIAYALLFSFSLVQTSAYAYSSLREQLSQEKEIEFIDSGDEFDDFDDLPYLSITPEDDPIVYPVTTITAEPPAIEEIILEEEDDIFATEEPAIEQPTIAIVTEEPTITEATAETPILTTITETPETEEIAETPFPFNEILTEIQTKKPTDYLSDLVVEEEKPTPIYQPAETDTTPLLTKEEVKGEEEAIIAAEEEEEEQPILINFNDVNVIEYIRFISKVSGKNFIFDEKDLGFKVTIVSEEPTTISSTITALMQELRINGLSMIEQGNNIIIHKNPSVNAISTIVGEGSSSKSEIQTRVFQLNTVDANQAATLLRPLTSTSALLEVVTSTNHLVVTDLASNIRQMAQLIKNIDSPKSGIVIGQYVVRSSFVDTLVSNGQQIMQPIAQEQPLNFVPHFESNSIFIVSTPYLVEKSIQVLRYLDQSQAATQILDPDEIPPAAGGGRWVLDENGNWVFKGTSGGDQDTPPNGKWTMDRDGNWQFNAGEEASPEDTTPVGEWYQDENGNWIFKLAPGETIAVQRVKRPARSSTSALPVGHIERSQFTIYKLKYRRGNEVQSALRSIGETLIESGAGNEEWRNAINSAQWIESSNSLIFSGTPESLAKVSELIKEVDVPLRQVFIEILLLDTTLLDSLEYSVNWGSQFGGGNTAGGEAFISPGGGSRVPGFLNTANKTTSRPDISGIANNANPGFSIGIIGQNLMKGGTLFNSITALVQAQHQNTKVRKIMDPKIIAEDNHRAEFFAGLDVQYPTQSVTNDQGNVVTQNFEDREIGTRLEVTPFIGNDDIITMDILVEVSNVGDAQVQAATIVPAQRAGRTITKSLTRTRAHVPNNFFVVLSGIIDDTDTRFRSQVPCLGGAPLIGALFSDKSVSKEKRSLMIFMKPRIVDTAAELDSITQHQQQIFKDAEYNPRDWKFEVDEALDFLNVKDASKIIYDGCSCK